MSQEKIYQLVNGTAAKAEEEDTNEYVLTNECSSVMISDFINICLMDQAELKEALELWAEENFGEDRVESGDGYLFIRGEFPVLVTAHMDTVHKELIKTFTETRNKDGETILTSPQGIGGDDRCGIYMITELVDMGYKPYILFCEDEEIGGVGSNKFITHKEYVDELKKMHFLIELDRANARDLVYYSCGNKKFQEFCSEVTGYKTAYGSFSDISHLSPACDVASVNISCGYYRAHTTQEYVIWEEMLDSIDATAQLLDNYTEGEFKYEKQTYSSKWGGGYYDYYDDYYSGYGYGRRNYYGVGKTTMYEELDRELDEEDEIETQKAYRKGYSLFEDIPTEYKAWFAYIDEEGMEAEETVTGDSKMSCIAKFLMNTDAKWTDVLDYYFEGQP